MSITEKDVYLELLEAINKADPHVVGLPVTPSMLKVLSLQFTPEEARLALQVGLAGGTLAELSARTGIEKTRLKKTLETMAYKGTMWIDPGKADPVYRVLGSCAPGLIETALMGNIRFPYDVELGKPFHQALREWARDRLCTLGFPFAPVWAHPWALPSDARPEENLIDFLKSQEFFCVSTCPCRLSHWLADPGNHCKHLLETCLHCGDVGRWFVKHSMGREITLDEALDLLRRSNEDGLVHTINIEGFICNCCTDCCPLFMGFYEFKTKTMIPTPFIPAIHKDQCNACACCIDVCPVKALKMDDVPVLDVDTCIGCGLCVTHCSPSAIKLVRRKTEVAIPEEVKSHIG